MTTMQFLDYLHQHPASAGLAEEIAEVFVLRGTGRGARDAGCASRCELTRHTVARPVSPDPPDRPR